MGTAIYTVMATFPGMARGSHGGRHSSRLLLDPRGSVIGAPLRVQIGRLIGSDPRW